MGVGYRPALRRPSLILGLLLLAVAAVCVRWVFTVPIYQAPDEPAHLDYALAIRHHRGLFRVTGPPPADLPLAHPYSTYLLDRTATQLVACHREACMPPDYGSSPFFERLDAERPAGDTLRVEQPPALAWVYPYGYYTLLAGWLELLFRMKDSLVFAFFGARLLSVGLLMVSLLATYGTAREMGYGAGFCLWLTGVIGFFPLTLFVSSYVQPDNLSFTLVSLAFYFTVLARRKKGSLPAASLLGLVLGDLLVTKPHCYLCTVVPAVAALATDRWFSRAERRSWLVLGALVGWPSLLLGGVHAWATWEGTNYYRGSGEHLSDVSGVLSGLGRAVADFYHGPTFRSFWGVFGWADTRLVIHNEATSGVIRPLVLLATWVTLGLTGVRLRQVASRLLAVCRRRPRLAWRVTVSNPPLNGFLLFTVVMILFYTLTANRFRAQGRNWLPFLLPIFLTATVYAPRALRRPRLRKACAAVVLSGLTLFDVAGHCYAISTLRNRFFDPHHEQPMIRDRITAPSMGVEAPPAPGGAGFEARPFLVRSLPALRFVHAIRVRYVLRQPPPEGPVHFQFFWLNSASVPAVPTERRWEIDWHPHPAEKTLHVWVNDTIDRWGLWADGAPGSVEIREVVLYEPVAGATRGGIRFRHRPLYNTGMNIDSALRRLARDPGAPLDLAELAFRLAQDEYPGLDVDAYLNEVAAMAHEARNYVKGNLEARVAGLCRYLFHEMGFRGNQRHYYDPRNSYLNEVLDRRTGLPITLTAVAMAVGARAGLEVAGVGLPGHFVAKAVAGRREVLFDPFHGGRLLSVEDCEHLVRQVTGAPFQATPAAREAVPLGLMLQRMLNNLKGVYLSEGDFGRAIRVIERLRQLRPKDSLLGRDLGVTLLQAGRPGKAIDHLDAYLRTSPPAADAEAVRQLLAKARGEVARWN